MEDNCEYIRIQLISSCGQPTRSGSPGSPAGKLVERLTIPLHKKTACYKVLHKASNLPGLVNTLIKPSGFIKDGKFLTISFSMSTLLHGGSQSIN